MAATWADCAISVIVLWSLSWIQTAGCSPRCMRTQMLELYKRRITEISIDRCSVGFLLETESPQPPFHDSGRRVLGTKRLVGKVARRALVPISDSWIDKTTYRPACSFSAPPWLSVANGPTCDIEPHARRGCTSDLAVVVEISPAQDRQAEATRIGAPDWKSWTSEVCRRALNTSSPIQVTSDSEKPPSVILNSLIALFCTYVEVALKYGRVQTQLAKPPANTILGRCDTTSFSVVSAASLAPSRE